MTTIGIDIASKPDMHVEAIREGNGPVILLDSPEGAAILIRWARAHRMVLSEAHEAIARKHGIDTEGVIISRSLPAWK